jgi:hypothetical protein
MIPSTHKKSILSKICSMTTLVNDQLYYYDEKKCYYIKVKNLEKVLYKILMNSNLDDKYKENLNLKFIKILCDEIKLMV